MFEDAIVHRDRIINRGNPVDFSIHIEKLPDKRKLEDGEIICRVADDPVVVKKFQPLKPGNGVEGKTGMISSTSAGAVRMPKALPAAKG